MSEPYAMLLWGVLITALAGWIFFGSIYWERGAKARGEMWVDAIRWANEVLDPDYSRELPMDPAKLGAMRIQARRILRGESREVYRYL